MYVQEFKYLYNVKFNNKEFIVFNNENIPFYLLEIDQDTGKLKYPQFEDFFTYFNLHGKRNIIWDISNKLEGKDKMPSKKLKILPKIIYKGQAILLSLALLLSGCGKETQSNANRKQLLSRFQQSGFIAEYESYDEDVFFVHEYDCEEYGGETILCRNLDELKSYIGDYSPTYDDVINVFKEKKDIKSEYLECIITNLQRMKDTFPDLDLTVLYYNAKRMSFVEMSTAEISEMNSSKITDACYNMKTAEVFYDPNNKSFDEFTLIHETLGHGAIELLYYDDNLNKYVYSGFCNTILENMQLENRTVYYPYSFGAILAEGVADMIARKTTGKSSESVYNYGEEMLRLFADLCNMSYSELINSRGVDFYNNLHSTANLNNPLSYVINADIILNDYFNRILPNISLNILFESLMVDSATENVQKNGDEEIQKTIEIMNNTYFDGDIELYYYQHIGDKPKQKQVIISYNPNESSKYVEEELNKVSKR